MIEFAGKSVFKGIVSAKISVYKRNDPNVVCSSIEDTQAELERFYNAKAVAVDQLDELYSMAVDEVGDESAAIFMIHIMMLEDFTFINAIENLISNGHFNAEYAVSATGHSFYDMFLDMDDPYMQARSADVRDVTERLLTILYGNSQQVISSEEPAIIIAEDLSPSETVRLAKGNIIGFATSAGSVSSHTSILARTMKLPSIVGANFEILKEYDGRDAVIDGYSGRIYIDVDDSFVASMLEKKAAEEQKTQLLHEYKGRENITIDGRRIVINANVGSVEEIDDVIYNDAGGIGLFRTEFIYLQKERFPTEDELFEIYRSAVEKMGGKPVCVRVLDVGADKKMGYFGLPDETNPALGCRGIRYLLSRPEIFRAQLRAVYRASLYGEISVLYPMISTLVDIGRINKFNDMIKQELTADGIEYGNVKQGIIIETPSAVMISDLLAREADFLTIGTNDLAQYTLVIDREEAEIHEFYDPLNISMFRMIKMVIDNAHRYKKKVGICGEMGSDPSLTNIFLAMGADEISVNPSDVLPLRKVVCSTNVAEISQQALQQLWN